MAEYPAFPLWTDAYLSDTGHLTTIEHGAYLLLLMTMWRAGGRLPQDDKKLARFARLTLSQWERIKPTMMEFFTIDGDEISQGRLTDELAFVRRRSTQQSDNARAKSRKNKEQARATAQPKRSQTSAPTPTPTPISNPPLEDSVQATPFDELVKVLDEHHARAVVEHRKGFRGKFTAHAAALLAKEFAKCPDPNAGADTMIASGWQGFKVEWMNRRSGGRSEPTASEIFAEMERRSREDDERQERGAAFAQDGRGLPDPERF